MYNTNANANATQSVSHLNLLWYKVSLTSKNKNNVTEGAGLTHEYQSQLPYLRYEGT